MDDGSHERIRDNNKFKPGQTHIHRDRVNVKTNSISISNINRKKGENYLSIRKEHKKRDKVSTNKKETEIYKKWERVQIKIVMKKKRSWLGDGEGIRLF